MARFEESKWRTFLLWMFPLLLIVGVRSTIASPFKVPTGSMSPTIQIGDHILVSKLAYGLNLPWLKIDAGLRLSALSTIEVSRWGDPKRGDIVLFRHPLDPGLDAVKRVVGVPGDRVELRAGILVLNDEDVAYNDLGRTIFVDQLCREHAAQLSEEGLGEWGHFVLDIDSRSPLADFEPVQVPAESYFVLGDNRDESADSRVWGFVPRASVRGQAVGTWMSFDDCNGGTSMAFEWLR